MDMLAVFSQEMQAVMAAVLGYEVDAQPADGTECTTDQS
jgi:hypothetical protein